MTLMSSLTTQHGPFALPIIQSLKPLQVRRYLGVTCSSTFRSLPTGTKLEITGNVKPILVHTARKKSKLVDYDYKVGNKVLLTQEGILCKAESPYSKEPWTITTVHTNGTIRIQCRTQSERLNIWRVIPFIDE